MRPELLETIAVNVYGFGRITIQFIMAIFIAFYMLLDKERFSLKAKKGIYTFFPKEKADVILRSAIRTHHIFQNFIVGKAVDSLIIGILAFIGLNLMKAPYPLILSLIIGVTNMIPYFRAVYRCNPCHPDYAAHRSPSGDCSRHLCSDFAAV